MVIPIPALHNTRDGVQKALTGQGSTPTYGYVYVDGEEYKKERYELNLKVIAVVEGEEWTEVKVIIYCFDSCIKGISTRQIALNLTRMGIPTQRKRAAWNRLTVRQIIKNEHYTGVAYNGKWMRDAETNKFPVRGNIKLPEGIYPKIIEYETWELAQIQLEVNAEMSPRNNRHPQESILRGMMFCGICKKRMYVKHFNKPKPGHKNVKLPEYRCYVNQGIDDTLHHHSTSFPVHSADAGAWEFAVPYIRNPQLIREHVKTLKQQVVQRDHSQDIKQSIERIKRALPTSTNSRRLQILMMRMEWKPYRSILLPSNMINVRKRNY
jgi:hypothetical protein